MMSLAFGEDQSLDCGLYTGLGPGEWGCVGSGVVECETVKYEV